MLWWKRISLPLLYHILVFTYLNFGIKFTWVFGRWGCWEWQDLLMVEARSTPCSCRSCRSEINITLFYLPLTPLEKDNFDIFEFFSLNYFNKFLNFDKIWQFWKSLSTSKIVTFVMICHDCYNWYLGSLEKNWCFRKLGTLIHDNHSDLKIKSDTVQHSQFFQCFNYNQTFRTWQRLLFKPCSSACLSSVRCQWQ